MKYFKEDTYVKGFDGFKVNYGNGFDLNTGAFTTPINGIYEFSFTMLHVKKGRSKIQVEKNNASELIFSSNSNAETDLGYDDTMSAIWYMKLFKNDKIQLKVLGNYFYAGSDENAVFNGKYLRPI